MKLEAVSYNNLTLNGGPTIRTYMPNDQAVRQSPVSAQYVQRVHHAPIYGSKVRSPRIISLAIYMGADPTSEIDAIKQAFSTIDDAEELEFLVQDLNDGNRQWYVMATVVDQPFVDNCWIFVTLQAADGVWRAKVASTDQKLVTASGQTKTITIDGNTPVPVTITLTPTSAKSGGFNEKRYVNIYNPLTTIPYPEMGFDLTGGGLNTATLVADTSRSNQLNGGINNSVTTIDIDTAVGGGLPARGMGIVDTEQISWTGNSGTQLTGVTRGVGGTSAASHLDNAVIAYSHMLANGDDVRVFVSGIEVDRWFGTGANAMNQTATKIWINLAWAEGLDLTLSTAISNVGTPTEIVFRLTTKANKVSFAKMPVPCAVRIDNEVFVATGKSFTSTGLPQITGIARAERGTSAASHTAGTTVRLIEHDIKIAYGNQDATAPAVDDDKKPMFLLTSTNGSWDYDDFDESKLTRRNRWSRQTLLSSGKMSTFYGGDQNTAADPFAELGMSVRAWQSGAKWRPETARLAWNFYHPAGVTDVSADGEKYRNTTSWPATCAGLQKSADGILYSTVWTESTPTVISTWEAVTHNGQSLSGSYRWLRFLLDGGVGATANGVANLEIGNVTLTFTSANLPQIQLSAAIATYEIDAVITNTTTGDSIHVRRLVDLNESLEIDCGAKRITYLLNGSRAAFIEWSSSRFDWLDFKPGANIIQIDDTGMLGLTMDFEWQDRML